MDNMGPYLFQDGLEFLCKLIIAIRVGKGIIFFEGIIDGKKLYPIIPAM